MRNLRPNTEYFARACTSCLRYNDGAENDAPFTSFPSNTIKFTTLRETSVRNGGGTEAFTLEQNAPNPFSDETSIAFTLPEASEVSLTVHDTFGRVVVEVVKGRVSGGRHRYAVQMNALPSGMYSYRLAVNGRVLTRQMVFVR
ncbi:MAG: T9SS type A sorting domain-containing protein [Candidatus Kapabacteria bacterium]|nr:T9SS type A sorting domain-containing protein [Candidatus Kapabacteria bacterium]